VSVSIDEDALNAIVALQRPGKPDLLTRIVTLFKTESPKSIESMQVGLDTVDMEAVRVAAHTLKSSSAYVGALELSAQCKELEKAALNPCKYLFQVPSVPDPSCCTSMTTLQA